MFSQTYKELYFMLLQKMVLRKRDVTLKCGFSELCELRVGYDRVVVPEKSRM